MLSFPYPLRFLFASKPDAIGPVMAIVHRVIARWLADQAGVPREAAQCGAVCCPRPQRRPATLRDRKTTVVPPQICYLTTRRPSIRRRANPEMAIFSPFLGVGPSVIADSACPIMPAWLSPPAIAVAVDFVISVFPSARSESAMLHRVCGR